MWAEIRFDPVRCLQSNGIKQRERRESRRSDYVISFVFELFFLGSSEREKNTDLHFCYFSLSLT